MRDTWPISVGILVAWLGVIFRKPVKARRGIQVQQNPLREIEEEWREGSRYQDD